MKETLEEAMIKNGYHDKESDNLWREGVEFGAKWQQERSYNEEEVMNILKERDLHNCINMNGNNTWEDRPQWFEQFKKK